MKTKCHQSYVSLTLHIRLYFCTVGCVFGRYTEAGIVRVCIHELRVKKGKNEVMDCEGNFLATVAGGVHLVPGHKVNWGGPGGRPHEETPLDVCSTMNFPQCKQRAGGIFQEGKLRSTNDSRACPVKPDTLYNIVVF